MKTTYKIAIVGAGPAGCTLALLLHRAHIPVTIFESDSSISSRSQGGSLDLHTNSGLAAIKELELLSEFEEHARYDGEALAVADKRNQRYLSLSGSSSNEKSRGSPEIDRVRLREILSAPLDESGIIRWNCRVKSVSADGTIHFESGEHQSGFDLVVGADGAWSKIRTMLTDERPTYTGISGFEGRILNAAKSNPEIYRLTNRGSWISLGDCKGLACQQQGDGSILASLWLKSDETWTKEYDISDAEKIRNALHDNYADWAPVYHDVIDAIDLESLVSRTLYALPVDAAWEPRPGFTLIGDAAHLTSPFAGEGVNAAMLDACKLAAAIKKAAADDAECPDALTLYISRFEEEMNKRVKPIQQRAKMNLDDCFNTPGAPRDSIERFVVRNVGGEVSWYLHAPLATVVYVYFFFVKLRLKCALTGLALIHALRGK
ncbi:MAG: hypothetical protein M1820_002295 [Bogoriella megaspora]|nr:MAG: hypothetical protein M1820_002295 [Bogoriella megaspora]